MPSPPKRDPPPLPTPPKKSPETLELETQLKALVAKLQGAKAGEVYDLTVEIQRRRVSIMILREMDTGEVDPVTYKELNLLNRLLAGSGIESRAEEAERATAMTEATSKLARHGISPASAPGLVRAFEAIMRNKAEEPDDAGEPTPPDQSTH